MAIWNIQLFQDNIEAALRRAIESSSPVIKLREAIEYSLFPGGKRVRPVLAMALCHELGGEPELMASAVAAIELAHCASLIHDDLPALDDDDMRRGRPSCHKRFGEATAILAADYMMVRALHLLNECDYPSVQRGRFIEALGRAFLDLCDGQQLDLLTPGDPAGLLRVHALKTGSLFGCAARFGAIAASVSNPEIDLELATRFGRVLGAVFQICNDYADVSQNVAARGRAISSDIKNNKVTLFSKIQFAERVKILKDMATTLAAALERLSEGRSLEMTGLIANDLLNQLQDIVIKQSA